MRQRKRIVRLTPELYATIKADLDAGIPVKQIAHNRRVCTKTVYRVDHMDQPPRTPAADLRLKLYKPEYYAPRLVPVPQNTSGRSYEVFPRKFA